MTQPHARLPLFGGFVKSRPEASAARREKRQLVAGNVNDDEIRRRFTRPCC